MRRTQVRRIVSPRRVSSDGRAISSAVRLLATKGRLPEGYFLEKGFGRMVGTGRHRRMEATEKGKKLIHLLRQCSK